METITPELLLNALRGETKGIAAAILREASGQKKGGRPGDRRRPGRSRRGSDERQKPRAPGGGAQGRPRRRRRLPAPSGRSAPTAVNAPIGARGRDKRERSRRTTGRAGPARAPPGARTPRSTRRPSGTAPSRSTGRAAPGLVAQARGAGGRRPVPAPDAPPPAPGGAGQHLARAAGRRSRRSSSLVSCLAILPIAQYLGEATEHLAERTGPAVGGFLNATFGNAAELIIAIVALQAGLVELVKASIIGSILGNLLLILGLSLVAAGMRSAIFGFNRTAAGMAGPCWRWRWRRWSSRRCFHSTHPEPAPRSTSCTSRRSVAVILAVVYLLSLLFSLRTHRRLLGGEPHPTVHPVWGVPRALVVLAVATIGIAVESESWSGRSSR